MLWGVDEPRAELKLGFKEIKPHFWVSSFETWFSSQKPELSHDGRDTMGCAPSKATAAPAETDDDDERDVKRLAAQYAERLEQESQRMALEAAAAAAKAPKSKSQPNSKANTASSGVSDASTLKVARWLSDGTGHVATVESASQRDPMANVLAPPSAPARVTDPTTLKVARWLAEGAGR